MFYTPTGSKVHTHYYQLGCLMLGFLLNRIQILTGQNITFSVSQCFYTFKRSSVMIFV